MWMMTCQALSARPYQRQHHVGGVEARGRVAEAPLRRLLQVVAAQGEAESKT